MISTRPVRGCVGAEILAGYVMRYQWERMDSLPHGMGRLTWTVHRSVLRGGAAQTWTGGGTCSHSGVRRAALRAWARAAARTEEDLDFSRAAALRAADRGGVA